MEWIEAGKVVWRPSPELVEGSQLMALIRQTGADSYEDLQEKSMADPAWFWDNLLRFLDMRFYQPYDRVMDISGGKPWTMWCLGGSTNAYLNCIDKHKDTAVWDSPYLHFNGENGDRLSLSYREFDSEVCRLANALKQLGIGIGDVVGLYLPMIPEVFMTFFACAKVGAIGMPLFSGFGPAPIAVRLQESAARAVVTADGTWRKGQPSEMKSVLDEALADAPDIQTVIVVDRMRGSVPVAMQDGRDHWWADLVTPQQGECATEELPAETPLTLAFTSGTTGKPKGIIQTHVGFVTKIALDVDLTTDFRTGDCYFWLSDFGWMVGAMSAVTSAYMGGALVVAEGAPDFPDAGRFWRLIAKYGVTHFGIAPTAVRGAMRFGSEMVREHDLSSLKVLMTAGEPATPDAWNWLFKVIGDSKLPIINITGGTEVGCAIVTGTVIHDLKPCSFSGPSLGSGAAVFDDTGQPIAPGQVGELVMTQPSIGLTKGFWGEGGRERYLEAYWQDYPDVWRHGDFALIDEDGFWYLLGRSDDTIKVAGKRTGPAEIEALAMATGKIEEAAVIGLPDQMSGSVIGLIVIPKAQFASDNALKADLSAAVVEGMGRAYRPREIHFVPDLPRTRSMKVMRRVIRSVLLDEPAGDLSALSNPEAKVYLEAIRETRGG